MTAFSSRGLCVRTCSEFTLPAPATGTTSTTWTAHTGHSTIVSNAAAAAHFTGIRGKREISIQANSQIAVQLNSFRSRWRQISQSGVGSAGIVPTHEELEDRHACVSLGPQLAVLGQFEFERGEEALSHALQGRRFAKQINREGDFAGVANQSHRWSEIGVLAPAAEGNGSVLRALAVLAVHVAIG